MARTAIAAERVHRMRRKMVADSFRTEMERVPAIDAVYSTRTTWTRSKVAITQR